MVVLLYVRVLYFVYKGDSGQWDYGSIKKERLRVIKEMGIDANMIRLFPLSVQDI